MTSRWPPLIVVWVPLFTTGRSWTVAVTAVRRVNNSIWCMARPQPTNTVAGCRRLNWEELAFPGVCWQDFASAIFFKGYFSTGYYYVDPRLPGQTSHLRCVKVVKWTRGPVAGMGDFVVLSICDAVLPFRKVGSFGWSWVTGTWKIALGQII